MIPRHGGFLSVARVADGSSVRPERGDARSRDGCRGRFSRHLAGYFLAGVWLAVAGGWLSAVHASSLLIDQVPGAGGTLSYDGVGGPLIGADIVFEQVTGEATPLNSGATLTLVDGRLNFASGPNLAEPVPIYAWGGGGSFVLTADAVLDSSSVDVIVPANDTVILTGTFVGSPTIAAIGLVGFDQIAISAFGIDEKHPDILAYYGLNQSDFRFAHSDISANDLTIDSQTQAFTTTVSEADIVNTQVPEPTTFVLAILGSAILTLRCRRQRSP